MREQTSGVEVECQGWFSDWIGISFMFFTNSLLLSVVRLDGGVARRGFIDGRQRRHEIADTLSTQKHHLGDHLLFRFDEDPSTCPCSTILSP